MVPRCRGGGGGGGAKSLRWPQRQALARARPSSIPPLVSGVGPCGDECALCRSLFRSWAICGTCPRGGRRQGGGKEGPRRPRRPAPLRALPFLYFSLLCGLVPCGGIWVLSSPLQSCRAVGGPVGPVGARCPSPLFRT